MPRNVNADIDSTLFGDSKKNKARASMRSDGSAGLFKASQIGDFYSGGGTAGSATRTRKTMKLVTKNEVRDLTIRRSDTSSSSCVISLDDYLRMRKNSVPLAEQEDALAATSRKLRSEKLAEESELRKTEFARIDQDRQDGALNDLDLEAQEREEAVLARAKALLEDDEDEVRILKSTILQAQCQAVRDAQLKEKEEIQRALAEEEKRLDDMMEQTRLRKIEAARAHEDSLKNAYVTGRMELEEQIEDRRMTRLLEEELREAETQELLQRIEDMKLEDQKKAEARAAQLKEVQKEIVASNEYAQQAMAEKARQEKLEEEELARYMAEKVRAEEEKEKQQLEAKAAADAAYRKVLLRQERAMDTLAGREEQAARRAHEEKERITRAKEARDAQTRAEAAVELNRARKAQIEVQQRQKAMMAMAEKEEFENTIATQQSLISSQRAVEEKQHARRIANRDEILEQVKQKEREIATERANFFAEGVKIDEEARTRRARLDQIKQRKLDELVATGLDSGYLNSVKRQIAKNPVKAFS
eukprot:m.438864 g.438864  ORF g.438864 m.438864 type:complete len:532 (+) comp18295_c0_seq1:40-1635(+)